MDISVGWFKSQMICSNHNKSHLVIFSARFYCVSFFSQAAVKEKRDRAEGPGYCHSIAEPFWKSPLSICSCCLPLSLFPYGCTGWKASFYNFQVAHTPRCSPPPHLLKEKYTHVKGWAEWLNESLIEVKNIRAQAEIYSLTFARSCTNRMHLYW